MMRFFEIVEFYLDQNNMTTNPYSNDEITKIGCRNSTSNYAFNGLIDDVMIFDKALSGDEIKTLLNFGNLSYDAAGNLTHDQRGYEYEYDYENRIVKITKDGNDIAEFAYDALGRRIEKKDLIDPNNTRRYYHNYKWQVLCQYNASGTFKGWFVYGNYIDEVLAKGNTLKAVSMLYIHDHLYSPVALTDNTGSILERYEYDAYGNCHVLEPNFTPDSDGRSNYGNPYYFQGKRLDLLDSGSLELMSCPYRNYSTYLGRWLQSEKRGMIPNEKLKINPFDALKQYKDSLNLYDCLTSNPVNRVDPYGLFTEFICCTPCQKSALRIDEIRAQTQIIWLKLMIQAHIAADEGQYPWFTSFKLNNSLKILDRASAKLSDGKVKCEKKCKGLFGPPPVAWAMPLGNTVHICPDYWDWKDYTQAATLVHEGTHLGSATLDIAYFWQEFESPHDVLIIGWDIIASTYDTWILTEFCIPSYDCPDKTYHDPMRGSTECPGCS